MSWRHRAFSRVPPAAACHSDRVRSFPPAPADVAGTPRRFAAQARRASRPANVPAQPGSRPANRSRPGHEEDCVAHTGDRQRLVGEPAQRRSLARDLDHVFVAAEQLEGPARPTRGRLDHANPVAERERSRQMPSLHARASVGVDRKFEPCGRRPHQSFGRAAGRKDSALGAAEDFLQSHFPARARRPGQDRAPKASSP